jgi:hypothetical protein
MALWKPTGGKPRSLLQVQHWIWNQLVSISSHIGPYTPSSPALPVPDPDLEAHSHYIDHLVNVTIADPLERNQFRYESGYWVNFQEKFTKVTSVDYATTGLYDHETVVCTNTTPITITLQTLAESERVTVVRAGTGAVRVDGDGATIIGNAIQNMPSRYDAADLMASDTEWVLT